MKFKSNDLIGDRFRKPFARIKLRDLQNGYVSSQNVDKTKKRKAIPRTTQGGFED